jgi:hypothetical protein
MNHHLYLTLIPEALIASMLTPEEFASYYAIGEHDKPNGQVVFIEIDPSFRSETFSNRKSAGALCADAGRPSEKIGIHLHLPGTRTHADRRDG